VIDAAVGPIWALLADLESWPKWIRVPYLTESVTISSTGTTETGTEFVLKGRLKSRLFARIVEWMPERRLAFEVYRSEYPSDRLTFGRALITIDFESLDEQHTRVTCEHWLEGRGAQGRIYAATVMRPLIATNAQRIVDSLAQAFA
jgi:hypothetical protein